MTAAITGETSASNLFGLFLAVLFSLAVSLVALAFHYSGGPPQRVYGVVVGFGIWESQLGSRPLVRVQVDDREATIPISRARLCQLGDRIELDRRKALLGYRYNITLRGCFEANAHEGPPAKAATGERTHR